MIKIEDNTNISVSIVDYLGKIGNGVGLLLNVIIQEKSYQMGFWFNRDGLIVLTPDNKLLKDLDINTIYEYDKYEELCLFLLYNIKNPKDILDKYLNEK